MTLTTKAIKVPCRTNEFGFYAVYFDLQNVGKSNTQKLSKQEITCAALLCSGNYPLTISKAQTHESEKYELADKMKEYYPNFTKTAVYGVLASLRRKGILLEEGNLLVLDPLSKGIQATVREALSEGQAEIEYCIHFQIE